MASTPHSLPDGKPESDRETSDNSLNLRSSPYNGSGTITDPYVVEFLQGDPHNPMNFTSVKKWFNMAILTLSVFAVTLTSAAYSGSADELLADFHPSAERFALGISLYVLGFGVGPPLWAPLSELFGRRILFVTTQGCTAAFVAASAGANSMSALLVLRFLSGTFGAAPLTNAGGVIADMFTPTERGLAMVFFSCAPFFGPVLGPVMGGYVSMNIGWRWLQGICAIFIGVVWICGSVFIPETYGPVLLRRKARQLSKETHQQHVSVLELKNGNAAFSAVFTKALLRPWVLLFREPIVLVAATYLAIVYGTVYMFMPAFPYVFQRVRGWDEGSGGLAFLGLVGGLLIGLVYAIMDNERYKKLGKAATPESRLPQGAVGAIALPIGMFAFAWTNSPNIHWAASIILSAPFGFGCVPVFLSILNYLIDSYTIYAASVLGASAILRALFGMAFPLFTDQMYTNLGIHWASSIPAFLTLLCLPFPFIMLKYGAALRMKCKVAEEAAMILQKMRAEAAGRPSA